MEEGEARREGGREGGSQDRTWTLVTEEMSEPRMEGGRACGPLGEARARARHTHVAASSILPLLKSIKRLRRGLVAPEVLGEITRSRRCSQVVPFI